jgi:hypothetical protein
MIGRSAGHSGVHHALACPCLEGRAGPRKPSGATRVSSHAPPVRREPILGERQRRRAAGPLGILGHGGRSAGKPAQRCRARRYHHRRRHQPRSAHGRQQLARLQAPAPHTPASPTALKRPLRRACTHLRARGYPSACLPALPRRRPSESAHTGRPPPGGRHAPPALTALWPDRSVRTWSCTSADVQCTALLTGHDQAVHCVAWGAEPSSLLSGSQARP